MDRNEASEELVAEWKAATPYMNPGDAALISKIVTHVQHGALRKGFGFGYWLGVVTGASLALGLIIVFGGLS